MLRIFVSILSPVVFLCGCGHQDIVFPNGTELVYIDDGITVLRCSMDGRQLLPQGAGSLETVAAYCFLRDSSTLVCRIEDSQRPGWFIFAFVDRHWNPKYREPSQIDEYMATKEFPAFAQLNFIEIP